MIKITSIAVTTLCFLIGAAVQPAPSQQGQLVVKCENKLVTAIAFSPDGALLACGLRGSPYPRDKKPAGIDLRDAKTGRLLYELKAEFGELNSMAFSPDGRLIAATVGTGDWRVRSEDDLPNPKILGEAYLWDVRTGDLKHKLTVAQGQATSIAFSPDSRYAAIGAGDTTLRLWDLSTGKSNWVVYSKSGRPESVAFSLDGKTIATANEAGSVKMWDTSTGKQKRALNPLKSEGWISAVAFSPQGNNLASAGKDRLRLWNPESGKAVRVFEDIGDVIGALRFSPDGKIIAANSNAPGVVLWDVAKGRITKKIDTITTETAFDFTPDGKYLAVCNSKDFRYELGPFTSTIELYKF